MGTVGRPDIAESESAKMLKKNLDGDGFNSIKDDEELGSRSQLSIMGVDITPMKGSPAYKKMHGTTAKAKPKMQALPPSETADPVKVPELVLVKVSHATNTKEPAVEVTIMNTALMKDVREALATK